MPKSPQTIYAIKVACATSIMAALPTFALNTNSILDNYPGFAQENQQLISDPVFIPAAAIVLFFLLFPQLLCAGLLRLLTRYPGLELKLWQARLIRASFGFLLISVLIEGALTRPFIKNMTHDNWRILFLAFGYTVLTLLHLFLLIILPGLRKDLEDSQRNELLKSFDPTQNP